MRHCVFTAIFGDYDVPRQPTTIIENIDYLMFSEDPKLSPPHPWKLVLCNPKQTSPLMNAKHIKIMAHKYLSPKYDVSLWIDGNMRLFCNPESLWSLDATYDIVLLKHDDRDCLHTEAEACTKMNLDEASALKRSSDLYLALDFNPPTGLYFGGFVGRRYTKTAIRFNKLWWLGILNGTKRDQIHLPPALELSGIRHKIIPTQERKNLFKAKTHQ